MGSSFGQLFRITTFGESHGGGIGVVNLANLAAYTVYPGVAQIPGDSWLAESIPNPPS
jgi:hypothetical protein